MRLVQFSCGEGDSRELMSFKCRIREKSRLFNGKVKMRKAIVTESLSTGMETISDKTGLPILDALDAPLSGFIFYAKMDQDQG
jgi:hypothetical protein